MQIGDILHCSVFIFILISQLMFCEALMSEAWPTVKIDISNLPVSSCEPTPGNTWAPIT